MLADMRALLLLAITCMLGGCASAFEQIVVPAKVLTAPQLAYPAASTRSHEEGRIVVEVEVFPDGRAGARRVKVTSGHPRLDAAALEASSGFRFTPAKTHSGEAVRSSLDVPIVFRLDPHSTVISPNAADAGATRSYAAALNAAITRNLVLPATVTGNPICVAEVSTPLMGPSLTSR